MFFFLFSTQNKVTQKIVGMGRLIYHNKTLLVALYKKNCHSLLLKVVIPYNSLLCLIWAVIT